MARPLKQDPASTSSEDAALSREKIVDVALALIAEKGLDDFSLRDVARTLGVYPTALYWHIKDKNALLGEVCTRILSKVVPPRGRSSWQDWLRAHFRRYRKVMKQHPNLAQLVGARMLSNLDRNTDMIERILTVLEEAGCPDEHMVALYNTVVAAASGFATMEFAPPPNEDPDGWKAELQARVHRVSALRHPKLARHLPALANKSFILRWQSGSERPMDASFESYLDVFVLGLEAKNRSTVQGEVMKEKSRPFLGPIEPEALGPTLMHEHLLIDLTPPSIRDDPTVGDEEITLCNCFKFSYGQKLTRRNFRLDDREIITEEVREMVQAGGRSIVELTVGGLKPDPRGLQAIARATGAQVVMGCGHYVDAYQSQETRDQPVDFFAREIVGQLQQGAWNTDVRAGIIGEIGCQSPWTDYERRLMQGALVAQSETGAAINVHPGRHPDQPEEVIDFIRGLGHPVERVIMSHIDRTIFDEARLLRLADSGCVIEFDLFGWEHSLYPMSDIDMPNDAARVRMVRMLFDHGHRDRVLISHDVCTRTRLGRFGGHGYQHIFANVVPLMLRRGFSQADIDTLLVDNPRRLLTLV